MHLGRRPTRVPESADTRIPKPTWAWDRFVEAAIEQQVDAVALTGDVVDEGNKFYEAFSALSEGVERLVQARVTVLAVSGNHDHDVLPRLADQIPEFHLLGRGGRWREFVLERNGNPVIRFQGWSFPKRHFSQNPMAAYPPPSDDLPTLGLLHCDCDQPASLYGPVSLAELRAASVTAWLLGHIHAPTMLSEDHPLVLYPGSLQGLDPAEPGCHSAALLTLAPGGALSLDRFALAGLRWEEIQVSTDAMKNEDELQQCVIAALRDRHEAISGELGHVRMVGCRLRLEGRSPLHRDLPGLLPAVRSGLRPVFDGVEYFVEKIEDRSKPDLSLQDIARSTDPAGLLARCLLVLERREPAGEFQALIDNAKPSLEGVRRWPHFVAVAKDAAPLESEHVRDRLLEAGLRALEELLAQKEAAR